MTNHQAAHLLLFEAKAKLLIPCLKELKEANSPARGLWAANDDFVVTEDEYHRRKSILCSQLALFLI
jgi:hypothetical protein